MKLFFFVLFFKNLYGHIIDGGVVEHDNSSVRARLNVHSCILAELIVNTAEVVSHCLHRNVELVGDTVSGSIRQTVFEFAQFIECDCLAHILSVLKLKMTGFGFRLLI